ncbi:MAG: sigma-70 family RNA polymerase sigma factor [Bacteroidetes bacterium]|nr:sigma-70 family RNA polymerase sigma factor [Bacteroidota bacterium]
MDQEQLIKECKRGSAAAQKCLFDHFANKMMVICCRYMKNEADAEEAMLDGFYKFFRSVEQFHYKGEAALFAWLKRIMINECLMQLRKKNVFVLCADTNKDEPAVPNDVLQKLQADEIFRMILLLPVGYRTVFNLYEIEGMTHKEIGALLQISEGTSKSQLSKAKQLLQKMLTQNNNDYAHRKIN